MFHHTRNNHDRLADESSVSPAIQFSLLWCPITLQGVSNLGFGVSLVHLLLLHREYGQKLIELILEFLFTALFPHVQDEMAEQKSLVRVYIWVISPGVENDS